MPSMRLYFNIGRTPPQAALPPVFLTLPTCVGGSLTLFPVCRSYTWRMLYWKSTSELPAATPSLLPPSSLSGAAPMRTACTSNLLKSTHAMLTYRRGGAAPQIYRSAPIMCAFPALIPAPHLHVLLKSRFDLSVNRALPCRIVGVRGAHNILPVCTIIRSGGASVSKGSVPGRRVRSEARRPTAE